MKVIVGKNDENDYAIVNDPNLTLSAIVKILHYYYNDAAKAKRLLNGGEISRLGADSCTRSGPNTGGYIKRDMTDLGIKYALVFKPSGWKLWYYHKAELISTDAVFIAENVKESTRG